jgi:hypothetical protein
MNLPQRHKCLNRHQLLIVKNQQPHKCQNLPLHQLTIKFHPLLKVIYILIVVLPFRRDYSTNSRKCYKRGNSGTSAAKATNGSIDASMDTSSDKKKSGYESDYSGIVPDQALNQISASDRSIPLSIMFLCIISFSF